MSEFKKLLSLALEELDIAKLLLERGHYRTFILLHVLRNQSVTTIQRFRCFDP